ncbi:glycosyl-4,4'-diaponeurosporenoate acyltransferase CrtO family protein [Paenibacillus sp. strain BS8-2]
MIISLPEYGIWLANAGGWLMIQLGLSYLFTRLPAHWFEPELGRSSNGTRTRPDVTDAEFRFYERTLRIRFWKDKLPDGGGLFKGGFAKKRLQSRTPQYLGKFAAETRRGEWNHWCAMLPAPLFFMWNEYLIGWIMILYAFVINAPFIAVLRYNRYRLQHIRRLLSE